MAGFIHQAFLWHAFVANDVPRDDMLLGGMLFRFNVSPYKLLYP
ncbi:hypothetical protein [Staphylococcus coagulans]|nr:hypothetical protein [Staphylococcus coagulans]